MDLARLNKEKGNSVVDLNIVNFITIGLIATLFWALFKFGMNFAGLKISWLD